MAMFLVRKLYNSHNNDFDETAYCRNDKLPKWYAVEMVSLEWFRRNAPLPNIDLLFGPHNNNKTVKIAANVLI